MSTCLLCHAHAPDEAIVCPSCGGALDDDPTRVAGPSVGSDATVAFGARPDDATRSPGPDAESGSTSPPITAASAGALANPGPRFEPPGEPPSSPGAPTSSPWGGASSGPAAGGPPVAPQPDPWAAPAGPPGHPPPPDPWGPPVTAAGPQGPVVPSAPAPWGTPGYAPWGGYGFVPAPRTNPLAIWSMCVSIGGLALGLFCLLPALACPVGAILGHVSLSQISKSGDQGRGLALAGVIIGWLATAVGLLLTVLLFAVVASGDPG